MTKQIICNTFSPILHALKIFTRFYAHGLWPFVETYQLKLDELK